MQSEPRGNHEGRYEALNTFEIDRLLSGCVNATREGCSAIAVDRFARV